MIIHYAIHRNGIESYWAIANPEPLNTTYVTRNVLYTPCITKTGARFALWRWKKFNRVERALKAKSTNPIKYSFSKEVEDQDDFS